MEHAFTRGWAIGFVKVSYKNSIVFSTFLWSAECSSLSYGFLYGILGHLVSAVLSIH